MLAEVGPLGINVTCIEPDPLRTDWTGRSLMQTSNRIADYAETTGKRTKNTLAISGKHPGDQARAVEATIRLVESESPPRHLVLGPFGVDMVAKRLRATLADIGAGGEVGIDADFPADPTTARG
ncbi:hypothetical protein QCE73_25105 [Caballeronia sp. LZ029]|uniref:hypothetical protein n=1 Tax=Caballeronia sp. LZ029 TaxID=3038564 RepID=UPI0028576B9B|nr:hypothetical protein [Caballeronia sp. LZ029]MDR5746453.1 hypothetical protein [Caballeronia sp. LZ029]